jgi:hypothetical protein
VLPSGMCVHLWSANNCHVSQSGQGFGHMPAGQLAPARHPCVTVALVGMCCDAVGQGPNLIRRTLCWVCTHQINAGVMSPLGTHRSWRRGLQL